MYVRPNLGSDWRQGAIGFLKFMTVERSWRRNWIAFGSRFLCVGVIGSYTLEDNDNSPVG